ncbi:hypothetical protein CR513_28681, partial [Mucuna pruriens]
MFIKTKISASIWDFVYQHDKVRDLMHSIDEQFTIPNKSIASTLMMQFSFMKLTRIRGMLDHIMCIRDIVAQLNGLEVTMSPSFLVLYILCTLPHDYAPFKISYNTHKDKWSINELLTMCEKLITEEDKRVNLTIYGKNKKNHVKNKGKIFAQPLIKKKSKSFFCKKNWHMKKDYIKFKNWFDKKGMENLRKPMGSEQYIYSNGRMTSHVKAIGTLAPLGFSFNFLHISFTLSNKTEIIGFGALMVGLYEIKLQSAPYNSMHVIARILYVMALKIKTHLH